MRIGDVQMHVVNRLAWKRCREQEALISCNGKQCGLSVSLQRGQTISAVQGLPVKAHGRFTALTAPADFPFIP